MKALVSLLLFLSLLSACNSLEQPNSRPANILPVDTFVAVLVDYSIAESITNLNIKSVQPVKFDSAYAFNPLKMRHIRKTQFDSTVFYYSGRPAEYRVIYDTVLSHLNTARLARERFKTSGQSK